MEWKTDWPGARENLIKWWRREGLAVCLTAPRGQPAALLPAPPEPDGSAQRWCDPEYRCAKAEHAMANTAFYAEAFPYFDTYLGPGSLGMMIGARPVFADETVWYEPSIDDPDTCPPIRFDPADNAWWNAHMALIELGLRRAEGRYLVGIPDLVENLDTLAALRGTEAVLVDLIERPAWVHQKLAEINEAFFAVFEGMFRKVVDGYGGNAFCSFRIWGPGRTAKLQCDISCMISPAMFDEFVVPYLDAQCRWLDNTMYHLDGEHALVHLDRLLGVDALDAVEWTPIGTDDKVLGLPGGGSPHWYDLYRRIKAAGKSVQALGVKIDEVVPLIDAVGPEGLFIIVHAPDQAAAEALAGRLEQYR